MKRIYMKPPCRALSTDSHGPEKAGQLQLHLGHTGTDTLKSGELR